MVRAIVAAAFVLVCAPACGGGDFRTSGATPNTNDGDAAAASGGASGDDAGENASGGNVAHGGSGTGGSGKAGGRTGSGGASTGGAASGGASGALGDGGASAGGVAVDAGTGGDLGAGGAVDSGAVNAGGALGALYCGATVPKTASCPPCGAERLGAGFPLETTEPCCLNVGGGKARCACVPPMTLPPVTTATCINPRCSDAEPCNDVAGYVCCFRPGETIGVCRSGTCG